MQFISALDSNTPISFAKKSLFLPSLNVGNIGQLSIDVILTTFQLKRVGFLVSPYVTPSVGNYTSNSVTTSLEVFQSTSGSTFYIQQRAPICKGRNREYTLDLVEWIKASEFSEVILLNSAEKSILLQEYENLGVGPHIRTITVPKDTLKYQNYDQFSLSDSLFSSTINKGTMTAYLIEFCTEKSINLLVVTLFVSESDNMNVVDALQLCQILAKEGNLGETPKEIDWAIPDYWKKLFQSGPINKTLY
jgi:proteasome assembly chaperone 2